MELLDSFHFARPWALLIIPFLLLQVLWYLKFRHSANPWQGHMRTDLQAKLLQKPKEESGYLAWIILAITLTGFALAGPSWSQQSRPVFSKQDSLVIVLDMSLSMLTEDIQPNRAQRSKLKLMDLLDQRKEGLTGLVVYAGEAYTVTPLTADTATIRNLLPALEPTLMPKLGSAAEAGIIQAQELMAQAGVQKGRILLVTDGIDQTALKQISKQLNKNTALSILAVGTEEGAPIPLGNQGFVKDAKGNVIISQLDFSTLEDLQQKTSARLSRMQLENGDLDYLLAESDLNAELKEEEAQLPLWIEQGHWFLLPVLPLAALAFRRGWLMLLPLLFLFPAKESYAFWWSSPEEQAQLDGEKAFQAQQYDKASELLNDPLWQGSAYYRNQQYEQAAQSFSKQDSAQAHYNRGNALTQQGKLDEALNAYGSALDKDPTLKDAQHNQELVQKMLEQQKQKQEQDKQGEDQQDKNESQDNQQDQNQQNGQQNQGEQNQKQDGSQDNQQGQNNPQSSQESSQQSEQNQNENTRDSNADKSSTEETPAHQEQSDPTSQKEKDAASRQAEKTNESAGMGKDSDALSEEDLSLEQWLRRVPDDPSGLLKRKFEYQSSLRNQRLPEGREAW